MGCGVEYRKQHAAGPSRASPESRRTKGGEGARIDEMSTPYLPASRLSLCVRFARGSATPRDLRCERMIDKEKKRLGYRKCW